MTLLTFNQISRYIPSSVEVGQRVTQLYAYRRTSISVPQLKRKSPNIYWGVKFLQWKLCLQMKQLKVTCLNLHKISAGLIDNTTNTNILTTDMLRFNFYPIFSFLLISHSQGDQYKHIFTYVWCTTLTFGLQLNINITNLD